MSILVLFVIGMGIIFLARGVMGTKPLRNQARIPVHERVTTRMTLRERITTLVLAGLLLFGAFCLHVYR